MKKIRIKTSKNKYQIKGINNESLQIKIITLIN